MANKSQRTRRINGLESDIQGTVTAINQFLREIDPQARAVTHHYSVDNSYLTIGYGVRPTEGAHARVAEMVEKAGMVIEPGSGSWGIQWDSMTQDRLSQLQRLLDSGRDKHSTSAHDAKLHEKAKRLAAIFNKKMHEVPGDERPYFVEYFVQQSRQLHLLRGGAMAQDQLHQSRGQDQEVWEKAGAFARLFDNEVSGLPDREKPVLWKYMCQESHALEKLPKPQQGRVGGGWAAEH